ncbi:VOC family protein [Streptomyces atroolivaceus]|uniref:VOC family protein n=1 Tax=Streptomyces atroolivaceus TaxID=66869 RepID=UPI00368DF945
MSSAEYVAPTPGMPCWANLMVSDLRVSQAFYTAVLGWEFRQSSLGAGFLVGSAGGAPVAGIGERRAGFAPPSAWTPYFAVRDADLTAARVQERGATLAVGPVALGEGRAGLAADRDGATFGFWEGSAPAWSVGEGSAPARLDLQTRDVSVAAVFYGEVLGWGHDHGIDVVHRRDHVLVEREGKEVLSLWRGGAEDSADPQTWPQWMVNFAVDDVEHAVAMASEGGGEVRVPTSAWVPDGSARVLRDPDGALFTVSERRR